MNKSLSNFLSANNHLSSLAFDVVTPHPCNSFVSPRSSSQQWTAEQSLLQSVMTSRRRSTLSGIEPSSESSSLLECLVQPLSGYQILLLTAHSTFKWATLFLTRALQRLVFPKVPLSAQRFSFFSLTLLHLAHPVQQTALQMTPAQSHLACHSSPLNKKSNPTSQL